MENDEGSPIRKTPGLENEYDFSNSRRSSTSLSLVGTGETPTELREMNNVYDRVQTFSSDSPISPPVHPRCRSTTDYTTTQKSMQSTTPTPKFECTRSQCPSKSPTVPTAKSGECTPMCFRSPPRQPSPPGQPSPPRQQCRSPPPQQCVPCATRPTCQAQCSTQSPCGAKSTTQSPCRSTQSPFGAKCTTQPTCTTRCTSRSPLSTCATQSPPYTKSTMSPCTSTRAAATASTTTKCAGRVSGVATCPTRPSMPSRLPTMPSMPNMYTPSSPRYPGSSPTCTTSSPTCTTGSPTSAMRAMRSTRSPDCTTSTTPICTATPSSPRSTPTSSPGVQSMDSRGAQCPLESCRDTCRSNLCAQKEEIAQQKMCPLDLCKMRAGLPTGPTGPTGSTGSTGTGTVPSRSTTSASRSICSSPTSNNSTKRAPFPSKKTDDDSGGGVVRWTEKCSQRCKRPTWNSNRWNCDKPATRPCVDCTGAHPAVSRCAQDYDAHRFGAVDGRAMRKCDCCDKRSYPPMVPNQLPSYQTIERGPPISSCGCDGFARGVNHFRKPPVMPQNPFDNSNSAYFNRLHKGLPFSGQPPPPPPPPPSFNSMQQPPFNPPFSHPPANVSTVTTRDNSLNVLQDNDNFSPPMKSCGGCDQSGPPDSPNQNINIVTNPHMFNSVYLPHNSAGSTMPNHHYMYGHPKESNI